MNLIKILAPDFIIGRVLVTARMIFDVALLVVKEPSRASFRFAGLVLRVKPKFTMVKTTNLKTLFDLVREVDKLRLTGDIVECGVWNGGSAAVMGAAHLETGQHAERRRIWLFDSFKGLPAPGEHDGKLEKRFYFEGMNRGAIHLVRQILGKIGFPSENVMIVPGWFHETLENAPIKDIAVLHIDADWYDSVKIVLEMFFDRVVLGGFVVLDDYGYWRGCDQALKDFLADRKIERIVIEQIGRQGAYFRKPCQ